MYFTPTYSESSPAYMQFHPSSLLYDTGEQKESVSFYSFKLYRIIFLN